jgi:hypothetical protein
MSAAKDLTGILEQWLQLTKAESAAIQAAGWPALQQLQARKAALRQPLAEAVKRCAAEEGAVPRDLRAKVGRIISLLTRNGAALAERLRRVRERQEALDQVERNLHRIRRSYAPPPRRTAWHSYS